MREFFNALSVAHEQKYLVGRRRGTGVVRENPEARADGEVFGAKGGAFGRLDDPVLLIRALHEDGAAAKGRSVDAADEPVAVVALLARRAAVARHRHPAGVDDHLALGGLMSDHGRKDRARDVVDRRDADVRHEEVKERIDAAAHFGDARFVLGHQNGRRGAHRHDVDLVTRFAQTSGGEDDPVALAFGRFTDVFEVGFVVARPCVRENSDQMGAFPQVFSHSEQFRRLGGKPRAVPVDVHFEKDRHRNAVFMAEVGDGVRRRGVVENDFEVAPAFT